MYIDVKVSPKNRKEYIRVKTVLLNKDYKLSSVGRVSNIYRKQNNTVQLVKFNWGIK